MTPEQVRQIRERFGLTQAQAASAIGVSARTWHAWELPRDRPNARTPGGLARVTLGLLNTRQ